MLFLLFAGTPFRVNVDAADGQYVSAYGPGLVQGGCGEKLHFFIAKGGSARKRRISGSPLPNHRIQSHSVISWF